MTNDIAPPIESTTSVSRVPPHAKVFVERARKLEALPVAELARRVAEGLARLRADFQIETRQADPLSALLAALPGTEIGRRGAELERDLAAARDVALERERAAAEVERRSESLKEALRERSADLAAALARVSNAETGRERAVDEARTSTIEIEELRALLVRATDEHTAELALASAEGEERARLEREVAASATEIEGLQRELAAQRGQIEALRMERDALRSHFDARGRELDALRREQEALRAKESSLRERVTNHDSDRAETDAQHGAEREFARAAAMAAEARDQSARDVLEIDRAALAARASTREVEIEHLARERAALSAEIAAVREQAHRVDRSRVQALDDAQHVVAELREKSCHLEREMAWRAREMEAVRSAAVGVRWKLLGGDLAERVAGWSQRERQASMRDKDGGTP